MGRSPITHHLRLWLPALCWCLLAPRASVAQMSPARPLRTIYTGARAHPTAARYPAAAAQSRNGAAFTGSDSAATKSPSRNSPRWIQRTQPLQLRSDAKSASPLSAQATLRESALERWIEVDDGCGRVQIILAACLPPPRTEIDWGSFDLNRADILEAPEQSVFQAALLHSEESSFASSEFHQTNSDPDPAARPPAVIANWRPAYRARVSQQAVTTLATQTIAAPWPQLLSRPADLVPSQQLSPLIPIGERLSYFGGATYVPLASAAPSLSPLDDVASLRATDVLTSRFGVVYSVAPDGVSAFYSVSQPQTWQGLAPLNSSLDEFLGLGGEVHQAGLRRDWLDGRWSVTASGFLVEEGVESFLDDESWSDHGGLLGGRGVELRVSGKISRSWRMTANITRLESRSLADRSPDQAWAPERVQTRNTATIWVRRYLIQKPDERLSLGLAARLVNQPSKSYSQSLLLPGYARWDGGVFYEHGWMDCSLTVESLLDSRYASQFRSLLDNPVSPLSIKAQLRWRY